MKTRSAALVVAAVTIAVYHGALSSRFVGDDFMILHRLREGGGLLRFFRGEFFEYYRPLGFVFHAADWRLAGASAWQFHFTNLLLHVASALLVLLIGRALSPGTMAGPLAAALFALHPSNHEAVVWISARFDLLATGFSLAAVWLMIRGDGRAWAAPAAAFLCAALSKESAVAIPLVAAGFAAFVRRAGTAATIRRVAPWLAALALYAVLRHLGGGVSPTGGAGKLPKLAAFGAAIGMVVLLAGGRWLGLRRWLLPRRLLVGSAAAAALAGLAAVAARAGGHGIAADKLAVAGFALFNLFSPVVDVSAVPFYLDPGTTRYWAGGAIALAAGLALAMAGWRTLLQDDRLWFLGSFLLAALLPISALTEGTRYLYLPSAALSLMAGVLVADARPSRRVLAAAAAAALLAVSVGQILLKVRDWNWAGALTDQGARLVDASLAPSCGEGRVVFLTEPVALRGVYTHFLYETFELPRGCMPASFEVLIRMVRIDAPVEARWSGTREIVITAPRYAGNLSLSADLRHFGPPLGAAAPLLAATPLGTIRGERDGEAERLTLSLAPGVDPATTRFFYYSEGRVRAVAK